MANYVPNTWNTNDVITKTKMDRNEAGIAAALPSADAPVLIRATIAAVVPLTDAATVATNAALGTRFRLTTGTSGRVLGAPTNATDGDIRTWEIIATAAITMSAATGSAGAFLFGATITGLTATTSGKRDLITAMYSGSAARWLVTDYLKNF